MKAMTAQTVALSRPLSPGRPRRAAATAQDLARQLAALGLRANAPGEVLQPVVDLLVERTAALGVGYFALPGAPVGGERGQPLPLLAALDAASGVLAFRDTRRRPQAAGLAERGVLALLAAPVRDSRGRLAGALLAYGGAARVWTAGDQRLLGAAAGLLTLRTAPQAGEPTGSAHEGTLRAIGLLLEARDADTRGHTDRVTALALRLGRAMGLSAADLDDLRWGARLHDIGKIALPDEILRYPGALDAPARVRMQGHVAVGTRLAGQLPFVSPAALAVIAAHHEQWDGGGYPRGLAGEAIPLPARILTACDVYDALTSARAYKRAWTPAEAAAHLERCSGTHFDPAVVAALLHVLEDDMAAHAAQGYAPLRQASA